MGEFTPSTKSQGKAMSSFCKPQRVGANRQLPQRLGFINRCLNYWARLSGLGGPISQSEERGWELQIHEEVQNSYGQDKETTLSLHN